MLDPPPLAIINMFICCRSSSTCSFKRVSNYTEPCVNIKFTDAFTFTNIRIMWSEVSDGFVSAFLMIFIFLSFDSLQLMQDLC